MSAELYEVLSLAARYLFALLGIVIVLRAYFWLLSDRAERKRLLRRLPFAGTVGEFVVVAGGPELPEGTAIPVPWEGILGSVRVSDLCVPCEGVRRKHLSFFYDRNLGLLIRPFSGCEAQTDAGLVNCHSRPESAPLRHGSFLGVGQAVLRLRVYAALDPSAGFDELRASDAPSREGSGFAPPSSVTGFSGSSPESLPPFPAGTPGYAPPPSMDGFPGPYPESVRMTPDEGVYGNVSLSTMDGSVPYPESVRMTPDKAPYGDAPQSFTGIRPDPSSDNPSGYSAGSSDFSPPLSMNGLPDQTSESSATSGPRLASDHPASSRRRRSDRWEADWSD